jgi:hypothetical protein
MVAFICGWHPDHERSRKEIGARVAHGESLVIVAPALVEPYSVLTRLPVPYRLSATDALFCSKRILWNRAKWSRLRSRSISLC